MNIETIKKAISNPVLAKDYLLGEIIATFAPKRYCTVAGNRSGSEHRMYIHFVERANRNYKVFSRFKSHPHYREILEHVSREHGAEYLKLILEVSPDLIQKIEQFKINDIVGKPMTFSYSKIGNISPTTLRYLKVTSDLRNLFGDLNGKKVAEIGVGYGGQLLVLDRIYSFYQYHLFDLQPVLALTSRYLEHHTLNSSYKLCTLNQCDGCYSYDLAISNYGFSELPIHIQVQYIKKVLSKSKCGYLTMNSGKGPPERTINQLTLVQLHKLLPPFQILEERPLTRPENYILVWGQS